MQDNEMKEKQAEQEAAERRLPNRKLRKLQKLKKLKMQKMRRKPLSLRLTRRMPKSKSCKIVY